MTKKKETSKPKWENVKVLSEVVNILRENKKETGVPASTVIEKLVMKEFKPTAHE